VHPVHYKALTVYSYVADIQLSNEHNSVECKVLQKTVTNLQLKR